MKSIATLILVLNAYFTNAQQPLMGWCAEIRTGYSFITPFSDEVDNILDANRNNAIEFSATALRRDTVRIRHGSLRYGIGVGTGLLLWDEKTLMPIQFHVNIYPFIRDRRLGPIVLRQLAFHGNFAYNLGAWKETTDGQLSGGGSFCWTLRYNLPLAEHSLLGIQAGAQLFAMPGPYRKMENGIGENLAIAEFIGPYIALTVQLWR